MFPSICKPIVRLSLFLPGVGRLCGFKCRLLPIYLFPPSRGLKNYPCSGAGSTLLFGLAPTLGRQYSETWKPVDPNWKSTHSFFTQGGDAMLVPSEQLDAADAACWPQLARGSQRH